MSKTKSWWDDKPGPRPWPGWKAFSNYVAEEIADAVVEPAEPRTERKAAKPAIVRQRVKEFITGSLEEKLATLPKEQLDELILRTAYRCEASLLRRGLLDDFNDQSEESPE